MKKTPSRQYLNECFTYDPLTGELFWKERPRHHFKTAMAWLSVNTRFAGKLAGSKHFQKNNTPGYITISTGSTPMPAHNIIFELMGVSIPAGMEVDHKNTDPFDNSWTNLRLATKAQNVSNRSVKKATKYNLPKGVTPHHLKFKSQICCNYKKLHIGLFDTPEEAHAAYCAKAKELHGEFARFN